MPQGFEMCIKEGGKVITKKMDSMHYRHMCKDKNGKWHSGEMKEYKKALKGKK